MQPLECSVLIGKLFKQHVPPTENNQRLLRSQKKVIFLCDPDEVVEPFFRRLHRKLTSPPPDFAQCTDWRREPKG